MGELWKKSRWLVLGAVGIVGVSFGWSQLVADELPADPLALAPADATVVGRVDVPAVTRSRIWNAFLEEDDQGVRSIETTCGYDPLDDLEQVVVFAFGEEERPFDHLGFVARGELARGADNRERLVRCVRSVLGERGGGIENVQVEGVDAVASAGGRSPERRDDPDAWREHRSHAAFLGDDGVVGGDREVLTRTIRRVRGDAPALTDPMIRHLWSRVAGDRDVVAVGRVPARWHPALRRMTRGIRGDLESLSALRALGVGATVRRGLSLGVAAVMESDDDARRLESAVRTLIDAALADPLARLSPLGGALRRVNLEAQERDLVLTVSLSDDRVEQLLELWRELRRQRRERAGGEGGTGMGALGDILGAGGTEPAPETETETEPEPETETEPEPETEPETEPEPEPETEPETAAG